MNRSLPVLMYHYISSYENPISVHPGVFDEHLATLTRRGYQGVGLDEAEAYLARGEKVAEKPVLVTFDDGFLDNWVHAHPLLEAHGHKGVVFAVTGKIEEAAEVRPSDADLAAGRAAPEELPEVDEPFGVNNLGYKVRRDRFINWNEARAMEDLGVMAIAGHSHSHTEVFTGPEYEKLFTPGPRSRTFDRVAARVVYGLPRFTTGPGLASRAFIPSDELYALLAAAAPQEPDQADAFFKEPGAVERLKARISALGRERLGRFESEQEQRERIRDELAHSAQMLTKELGRAPKAMAWPWGASCPAAIQAAREAGFTMLFTTAIGPNRPGRGSKAIHRFKVRNKPGSWLASRLGIHASPLLSALYARLHS